MTLKEMKDLYVEHGLDSDIWEMFYRMAFYGIINRELWERFEKNCEGWHFFNESYTEIIDGNERIIYRVGEDGRYHKVKNK